MTAWVIALGLGAGYLINKNLTMSQRIDESVKEYQSAAPQEGDGLSSEHVRQVQRRLPDADRYDSMNLDDLPPSDVRVLQRQREAAHQEVVEFESGPPPIEGVYLTMERGGV